MFRRVAIALFSLALVASSCGDDSGGDGPEAGTDDPTSTTNDPAADDGSDSDTDDAATDDGAEPQPEPEPLIASDRGVTEDTIVIGLATPDVSAFSNTGDIPARYQIIADEINDNGGLAGRRIELVIRTWDLLDSTGFDAACLELTEDIDVFAVISRTPANFGAMTCFTTLGDTLVINGLDLDAAELAESPGRLFSVQSDRFAALLNGIDLLADELADAKVAITTAEDAGSQERADILAEALAGLGIEVVATTKSTIAYTDDSTGSLAEYDRFSQVWLAEGATHVVGLGNGVVGAAYAIDNNALHDRLTLITPNINVRTLTSLGADLSTMRIIGVAVEDVFSVAERGAHGADVCLERVERVLGEEINFNPEESELNVVPSAMNACASFDALVAAIEEIGPNPTREAFVALAEGGFAFTMTGAENAHLSTDGYLNVDGGRIYDWNGTEFVAR